MECIRYLFCSDSADVGERLPLLDAYEETPTNCCTKAKDIGKKTLGAGLIAGGLVGLGVTGVYYYGIAGCWFYACRAPIKVLASGAAAVSFVSSAAGTVMVFLPSKKESTAGNYF